MAAARDDFDRYLWRDESDGATSTGPVWTVTLGGGQHRITLTVVSDRQGGLQSTASVPVDVLVVEQAPVEVTAIFGESFGGQAFHPFDPIARIQVFGRFVGHCTDDNGVETPFEVDRRGATPLVEGTSADLIIEDTTATFYSRYPLAFCPPGDSVGISEVELWAVAYTEFGDRGESEHIIRP